jgi:FkbM family methyltransferase
MSLVRISHALRQASRAAEVWRCSRCLREWREVAWAYVAAGRLAYPFQVHTRAGHSLTVEDRSEVTTLWHIFCAREYGIPADARTIVDLGANIGVFSLFAAERQPAAQIIAVEPFPSTFDRLQRMIAENELSERITPVRAAVQSCNGAAYMNAQAGGHSYARRIVGQTAEGSIAVPAMTVQSLLEQQHLDHVDLLKVDIEGGEYAMLEGCEPAQLRRCRVVAMEYHDAEKRAILWNYFEQAGFECVGHQPRGWSGLAEFRRV